MIDELTVRGADIAIVFATLAGPVLAVQAQKWLEGRREQRRRREWIFSTLMATRANRLAANHVEALNAVPIQFYGRATSLRSVIDSWKSYLDHLEKDQSAFEVWQSDGNRLFIELLLLMAKNLGYQFNRVELEKEVYSPRGHSIIETDQEIIRRGLAQLLSGNLSLPMDVKSLPVDTELLQENKNIQKLLSEWLSGSKTVKISIQDENSDG